MQKLVLILAFETTQITYLFCCSIAKDFGHAPAARVVLGTRAYEEPCWHHASRKKFLVIVACPKSLTKSLNTKRVLKGFPVRTVEKCFASFK